MLGVDQAHPAAATPIRKHQTSTGVSTALAKHTEQCNSDSTHPPTP